MDTSGRSDGWIYEVMYWGLAIILFLSPYFKGLYFEEEQEVFLILAAVLFVVVWMWKWIKRERDFLTGPLDYFALALPVIYFVASFQAANYCLAVNEFLKSLLCFMVYWLVSRFPGDEADVSKILRVIYLSAVGVAIAGLASATGLVQIKDGFYEGRLQSTLQYANALAGFTAGVFWVGVYFWFEEAVISSDMAVEPDSDGLSPAPVGKLLPRLLYAAGNYLLLLALMGSKSQGGLIIFFVAFLILAVIIPNTYRVYAVIYYMCLSVWSFFTATRFLVAVGEKNMPGAWLWILLGLAVVLAADTLWGVVQRKCVFKKRLVSKKTWLMAASLLIIAVVIMLSTYPGLFDILWAKLKFRSLFDRLYFFLDAFQMFKEHPLLGWGGGGWREAYQAYQSFFYVTNQTHGYYTQVAVETGVLGLAALAGIWLSFLALARRLYCGSKTSASRLLTATLTVSALCIGLHAAIDFDLSLGAIALTLWTIFGLLRFLAVSGGERENDEIALRKNCLSVNLLYAGIITVSIAVIFITGSFWLANYNLRKADRYMHANEAGRVVESLFRATSYNPLDPTPHMLLATYYLNGGEAEKAIAEGEKINKLSKYDARNYVTLSKAYFITQDYSKAVSSAEKAMTLAPFRALLYENLSDIYLGVGCVELTGGNKADAEDYFRKTVNVPDLLKAKMAGLSERGKKQWSLGPMMDDTLAIKQKTGAAQYFLGNWEAADKNLRAAMSDKAVMSDAALFLALLRDKQGRSGESQDLLRQVQAVAPEMAGKFAMLKELSCLS